MPRSDNNDSNNEGVLQLSNTQPHNTVLQSHTAKKENANVSNKNCKHASVNDNIKMNSDLCPFRQL